MNLCFLVEECYRNDSMPLVVARTLTDWGHQVDIFEPSARVARVSEIVNAGPYDAWVLKTVSGGPGLSILEAAAASGLNTINDARSIRPVRDKAVTAAVARLHGLPMPLTYFAAFPELLREIPADEFPLVVKPADGSSGRSIYIVWTPDGLAEIEESMAEGSFLLAQPYIANPGVDVKVYCTGGNTYATVQRSPLHPDRPVDAQVIALEPELAALAARVGEVFGLDIFGLDVLESPDGWVLVDVNDFPSFRLVPGAIAEVADSVLRLAAAGPRERRVPMPANVIVLDPPGVTATSSVAALMGESP